MGSKENKAEQIETKLFQPRTTVDSLKSENVAKDAANDEGSIFLILLFYYFQDASLVKFQPVYEEPGPLWEKTAKQIIGGIFKFRLDVLHLAKSVCVLPGMHPFSKVLLNLAFVPFVLTVITVIFAAARILEKRRGSKWVKLKSKAALGMMLAILFSYQKLATALFSLVHCIPIFDDLVLKIDGNMKCFSISQMVILTLLVLCIVPFCFYIMLAPCYLKNKTVSLFQFYLGCLFPLPFALFCFARVQCGKVVTHDSNNIQSAESKSTDETVSVVYNVLQGPYKEFKLPLLNVLVCWSGIPLFR